MGGSQKYKRITWASGVNLCQVKLFLSEECPSEVGTGTQDHLQAKVLQPVQSAEYGPDDSLPPGFEEIQPANLWRVRLSRIPLIKWKCPSRFESNSEWQVVAGEESQEIKAQNEREMRVLEAIYPRPSAIPPNPSAFVDVDDSSIDDRNIPLVPITPIEDDNVVPLDSLTANANPNGIIPQANGVPPEAVEPLVSLMSNSDEASLIDRDSLIRILSNRQMLSQATAINNASYIPGLKNSSDSTSVSFSRGAPVCDQITTPHGLNAPLTAGHHLPSSAPSPFAAPVMKGSSYYKRLIQQHGGRRDMVPESTRQATRASEDEALNLMQSKARVMKMKACIYFNSLRGCRNGANCAFQHEHPHSFTHLQTAKRLKLNR